MKIDHFYIIKCWHNTRVPGYILDLITLMRCLAKLVWRAQLMIHSRSWNRPRPGQRPRLEPRKLRKSLKLKLSRLVLLVATVPENPSTNADLFALVEEWKPSSTEAVVLRQGSRQPESLIPVRR